MNKIKILTAASFHCEFLALENHSSLGGFGFLGGFFELIASQALYTVVKIFNTASIGI